MNAGARGVKDEFADGNGHAAGPLVAEAEDAFVVGDDHEPDVALAEVAEALGDLAAVVGAKEQSARAAVDMAVLLAGETHRGGVDDRGEAFEVLDQQTVEEDFVAVQQGDQANVLFEKITLLEDMLQLHGDLLLDGEDGRRQQSFHAQLLALGERESGVFVLGSVTKNLLAARPADVKGRLWVHGLKCNGCFRMSLQSREMALLRNVATPPGRLLYAYRFNLSATDSRQLATCQLPNACPFLQGEGANKPSISRGNDLAPYLITNGAWCWVWSPGFSR